MGQNNRQKVDFDSRVVTETDAGRSTPAFAWEGIENQSPDNVAAGDQPILGLIRKLFLNVPATASQQLTFCGVDLDSGSSVVCARAAQMLAEHSSLSICLVDANPRMRRLAGAFNQPPAKSQACVQLRANLWFAELLLRSNSNHDLVPTHQVANQLKQLAKEFEYVLLDAPGVNVNSDAVLLAQMTGAAVLVVEADKTRKTAALRAKQALEDAGVRVLGTVLHNRSLPIPEFIYRYL